MSSEEKSRLARWSQRKAEARQRRGGAAPAIAEEPAAPPATTGAVQDDPNAGPDAKVPPPTEHDLPDIESLTAGSDFTAFMKEGVPAGLRRLALRKLWASDPMFNVIDEMVEYGEDYTNAATVVEGMKSAWEAGRGYADRTSAETADETPAGESAGTGETEEQSQPADDDPTAEEGDVEPA